MFDPIALSIVLLDTPAVSQCVNYCKISQHNVALSNQKVCDQKIKPISRSPAMSIALLHPAGIKIWQKLPLQGVLAVYFVVQISAAVGLVGYFWFNGW